MTMLKMEIFDGQRRFNVLINPEHLISISPLYDDKNVQVVGQCMVEVGMKMVEVNDTMQTIQARWEDCMKGSGISL